jgi:hypothetical protein
MAYVNSFIRQRSQDQRYRPESIKVYKTLRKHFGNYLGNRNLQFIDLDATILEGFINYMFRKDYSDNQNDFFTSRSSQCRAKRISGKISSHADNSSHWHF